MLLARMSRCHMFVDSLQHVLFDPSLKHASDAKVASMSDGDFYAHEKSVTISEVSDSFS